MNEAPADRLPILYACDLQVEPPEERWLIRQLWGRQDVGILGGPPKSTKTHLGLDFAVSVASGTPALDRFPVELPGTALVYLAEDALPKVRARLDGICQHRGLDIQCLDLALIDTPQLRLDTARDQDRLRKTIDRLRPRLLLLDPLVRVHAREENSASEISALLSYFRDLQRCFTLAIIIVHHSSKKCRSHPGQALRGSTDLWAFGDSNAYLSRHGEQITLTLEQRAAKPPEPMRLALVSTPEGNATHLALRGDVGATEPHQPALPELVLALLQARQQPLSRTEMRAQLRVNNQRLGNTLQALEKQRLLRRTPTGWALNGNTR